MNKVKIQTDIVHHDYAKKDLTIIHIADIHFNINTNAEKLIKVKESIIKLNPDYLVITGDLVDEPSITKNKIKIKELIKFLTDLSTYTKVLISLGNHDIFSDNDLVFFKKLNEFNNIILLDNDSYQDDYIYIAGLTLPSKYYYNITYDESSDILLEHIQHHQELISKLPARLPKVLLIHSPIKLTDEEVLNKLSGYDLILSGHTHAGMVPDFLNKFFKKNTGIIAPNKKWFPEISRGKIEKMRKGKRITIIITGGITKLSLKSSKLLSKLNFVYNISINKIIITKKRGKYYE